MSKIDDGGPAFPIPEAVDGVAPGFVGMSVRDYFAAHAPSVPQPWFKPIMTPRPSVLPFVSDDGQRFYDNDGAAELVEGDCYSSVNYDAICQWESEKLKQRYIQWPYAWADAMLAAREAGNHEQQQPKGWLDWNGGECPVPEGSNFFIRFRDGDECSAGTGDGLIWHHDGTIGDIIAYRIVSNGDQK